MPPCRTSQRTILNHEGSGCRASAPLAHINKGFPSSFEPSLLPTLNPTSRIPTAISSVSSDGTVEPPADSEKAKFWGIFSNIIFRVSSALLFGSSQRHYSPLWGGAVTLNDSPDSTWNKFAPSRSPLARSPPSPGRQGSFTPF